MAFILGMGDTYDPTAMMPIKRVPFMQKLLLRLSIPIYIARVFMKFLMIKVEKNPFHDGKRELSGRKLASQSSDLWIRDVKSAAKAKGVTINDLITSCMSVSVKSYFESKGDFKTKALNIVIPANIRFKPYSTFKSVKLENKFAVVPLRVPLTTDLDEALRIIPHVTSKMKQALGEVYTTYFFTKMSLLFLPYFFTNAYLNFSTKPFALAFSNMPGLLKPVVIHGRNHQKMTSYIQNPSTCGMTISCISYCDYFKITCLADDTIIRDPQTLVHLLEENLLKCYPPEILEKHMERTKLGNQN